MMYEARSQRSQPRYHVVSSAHLSGLTQLDDVTVHQAAAQLAARHDVLRTSFDLAGSTPVQVVHEDGAALVRYLNISTLDPEQSAARISEERKAEELDCPSMTRLPGWRLVVLRTGDTDAHVFLSHWHWLLDGWSVTRLLAEFAILLGAPGTLAAPGRPTATVSPSSRLRTETSRRGITGTPYFPGTPLRICRSRVKTPSARLPHGPGRTSRTSWTVCRPWHGDTASLFALSSWPAISRSSGQPSARMPLVSRSWTAALRSHAPSGALGLFLHPVPIGLAGSPTSWAHMLSQAYAAERELWPYRRFPLHLMSKPGLPCPPPIRICFTYADLGRVGGLGEIVETVWTGIPVLIDASPTWIQVETDPSLTALDPAGFAERHRLALDAVLAHPDSPPEVPDAHPGIATSVTAAPDILVELQRVWSMVFGRPGLASNVDVRELGCSSLDILNAAWHLEAALGFKVPAEIL